MAQQLINKKNIPQEVPLTDTEMIELQNNRLAARAFDDRIGVYIIFEAAKRAKEKGIPFEEQFNQENGILIEDYAELQKHGMRKW